MKLRPSLDDIRFTFDAASNFEIAYLDPETFKAFWVLLRLSAASRVWTHTEPSDGGVIDDPKRLARAVGLRPSTWLKVRRKLIHLFDERDGRLYPKGDWIRIQNEAMGDARPAISAGLRSEVMQRDAWTCVYCGGCDGQFDIDHVIPLSRGGSNSSADNLVCACFRCNRQKGARTPNELAGRQCL